MTSYDDLDAQLAALQATLKVEVQKVKIENFFKIINYLVLAALTFIS